MARCMTMAGVRPGMIDPQRQRLRPVHRRPRLSPGRRADRGDRRARLGRTSRPARRCCFRTWAPRSWCRRRHTRWSIAQALRRRRSGAGQTSLRSGLFGGEPWTEPMRGGDRARARARRDQLLRPVGDVRAGRRRASAWRATGLHVQEDHFHRRGRSTRDGRPLGARDRGRARLHHADQGGPAAAPLPDPRHRLPARPSRARADGRRSGSRACAAAMTTC